jgi:S-formylglutathione hydrolase FrmB
VVAACVALCMSRSRYYRAQKPKAQPAPRPRPPRALSGDERANVLATLDSDEFMDKAPAQVFAKLLEEGTFLCSTRPAIYLDCGTEDGFGLQNGEQFLHDILLDRGIEHAFYIGPGGHDMRFWAARLPASLTFLREHTQKPE